MKTYQFTCNAVGDPEAVVAQDMCRRITVGEDPSVGGYPTTTFNVRKPGKTDTPRRIPLQGSYTFYNPQGFQPGTIAGYVDLPSGSTTMFQDESE